MQYIDEKLYKFIMDDLGAKKYSDARKCYDFRHNVHNTYKDNYYCLNNYFPRSYKTSYHIFKDMYEYFISKGFKQEKNNIKILDIGSGTGGQLFGLLQVLNDFFPKTDIQAFVIDANSKAINISEAICEYKLDDYNCNIEFNKLHKEFISKEDYVNYIKSFSDIDIIVSFKCLNELYQQTSDNGFYTVTLSMAEQILCDDGIVCLLDNTNKLDKTFAYFPFIANKETHQYFKENQNSKLNFLMPFCCAKHISKDCSRVDRCFTSFVTHTDHGDDKVNSKLFIKDGPFAKTIIQNYYNNKCTLCDSVYGNKCHCTNEFKGIGSYDPLNKQEFYKSSFSFKQFNL